MRFVRAVLLLDVLAAVAVGLAIVLVAGAPLAARGQLRPGVLVALAIVASCVEVGVAMVLLVRAVARPVERLLASAERLGDGEGGLPILDPPGERAPASLARATVAFERVTDSLREERARLAMKVDELERTNGALAETRESWLRSERLAAVGLLASGVAHEVGNPLGAIAGFADLARGRISAGAYAEADDLVARIGDEATRIDRIVRDLLDFARPAPPAFAPIALGAVVEAALRLARVQARFRAVEAVVDLPPDLPPVFAEEGRLAQVFLNLLLNAGDAMDGAGVVAIRAREERGRVVVELADGGPGVPAADLPRIFDPFFTTKAPGRGTGLGLAVCAGILEALGGEIAAENAAGGGAVFRVALRAAPTRLPAGSAAS